MAERYDVLVIGAGPAGLAAAQTAASHGARVGLLDAQPRAGGQVWRHDVRNAPPSAARHAIEHLGGVELLTQHSVVAAEPPSLRVETTQGSRLIAFGALVLATGARELLLPFPGWTLPGVTGAGGLQALVKQGWPIAGKRVLIAGNGPLNLQLAAELIEGSAEVAAVVEAAARPGPSDIGTLAAMFAAAPGLVRDGLRYHARRRAGGAPMLYGQVAASIAQNGAGLTIELADTHSMQKNGRRFEVDVVCLGYGFEPANELLRLIGCGHDFDPARGHRVTRRDASGRTDVAGIYALGDCTGLGGARVALAEGTIVGLTAASDLGYAPDEERRRRAQAELRQHRRFQKALWSLYEAPAYSAALATPDTLICRCEEVSFGEVEAALDDEMQSAGAVKRRTRLGMGRCQARYCGPVLEALLEMRCGRMRDEFSGFQPRVPVKPLSIGELAQPPSD